MSGQPVTRRGGCVLTAQAIDHEELVAALPGLLRYANAISADAALAEDLVQTTLLRALEAQSGFRGEAALATWLRRILHNAFVDHLRRRRDVAAEDPWALVERQWRETTFTVDLDEIVAATQASAGVRDALLRLPMHYRAAIVLHDMEGHTVPEVARIQQVSLPAAKQRVRRGRMMLVTALAESEHRRKAGAGVPLDCWSARLQVSDYLDGQLDARQERLIEHHLEQCPTCPPLYGALVVSKCAVSDLQDADAVIPPGLAGRLLALRGDGARPALVEKQEQRDMLRPGGVG